MCNNYQNSNSEKPATAEPPRPRASRGKAGSPPQTPRVDEITGGPWRDYAELMQMYLASTRVCLSGALTGYGDDLEPDLRAMLETMHGHLRLPTVPPMPQVRVGPLSELLTMLPANLEELGETFRQARDKSDTVPLRRMRPPLKV